MIQDIRSSFKHLLLGFFMGIPFGCLLIIGIMGVISNDPRIMSFGNIKIYKSVPSDADDAFSEDLIMKKDDRVFFYASRNSLGEVNVLNLRNGMNGPILSLNASKKQGEWTYSHYGKPDGTGEDYIDLNFDGQFDIKCVLNNSEVHRYIYFEKKWKQTDYIENNKVTAGSETFIFNDVTGWQLYKQTND